MRKKTSRSTKFNVKFFARIFFFKKTPRNSLRGTPPLFPFLPIPYPLPRSTPATQATSELRLHFVFTHKGLSVKRGIGVGVEVFFLLKNAVLWLGLGLDVERHQRVTIARKVKSNCLPFLCVFKKINLNLRSTINNY